MLKKIKPPISQKLVDEFGAPRKGKKAWDGQDKDKYFRDRFAHVHAKQMQNRSKKESTSERQAPNPKFAQRFKENLSRNPATEHLFGTNPVAAALETRKVFKVFTGLTHNEIDINLLKKCSERNIPLQANTPLQHLQVMSSHGVHNQYVASVKKREYPEFENISISPNVMTVGEESFNTTRSLPLGVYIDQVTDTHNMGAILRSAYWLGADFVAFSKRNCAPMSPQVIKASAGAAEFLPIFTVNSPLKLLDSLKASWNIIATLPKDKVDLPSVEPNELKNLTNKPCLLIVGSEGKGLRTSIAQRSTHATTIASLKNNPLVDSLNVSVATALLLEKFKCT